MSLTLRDATTALQAATDALARVASEVARTGSQTQENASQVAQDVQGAKASFEDRVADGPSPSKVRSATDSLVRAAEKATKTGDTIRDDHQDALQSLREATLKLSQATRDTQEAVSGDPLDPQVMQALGRASQQARDVTDDASNVSKSAVEIGDAIATDLGEASNNLRSATRSQNLDASLADRVGALEEASASLRQAASDTASLNKEAGHETARATVDLAEAQEALSSAATDAMGDAQLAGDDVDHAYSDPSAGASLAAAAGTVAAAAPPGGWSWGTVIRYGVIVLILIFLGLNLFAQMGKTGSSFSGVLQTLLARVGDTAKSTVDTAAAGTTGVVDEAATVTDNAVDFVTGSSGRTTAGGSASGASSPGDSEEQDTHDSAPPVPSPDTAGSRTQSNQPPKSGYCYIGEDRGFRSCIKVNKSTQCMSGEVFGTRAQCLDPAVRE